MRDLELKNEFKRLTPRLHQLFTRVISTFNGDPATEVSDLLQETVKGALINSRLPQYDGYTCEMLIRQKAIKLVYEYCHPPLKRQPALPLEVAQAYGGHDNPHQDMVNRQWLESIAGKVDDQTWIICYLEYAGYGQHEVAAYMGISVDALRMKLYRARQRLNRDH